jgi:hypothetical protein
LGRWSSVRLLCIPAFVAACGVVACGESDETGSVEDAVRSAVRTYNAGDVDGFLALHTDQAIEDEYGLPRDLAAPRIAEFIGQPPIELRSLSNTTVDGNRATTEFERTQGKVVVRERVDLVKDGEWKLDGFEDRPVEIPASVTPVDIAMGEFAFAMDSSAVRNGNIALAVQNSGEQDHEAVIARIEEDANLDELVPEIAESADGETPEGVEEIVAFGAYEPGETGNVVFAEPLEPGRYAVLCFFPDVTDPEHTPHALKGMFAEFTVPG